MNMARCKSCGGVAYMGKACKPKDNPTKVKENNLHCPRCNWSDKPKKERKKFQKAKKVKTKKPKDNN